MWLWVRCVLGMIWWFWIAYAGFLIWLVGGFGLFDVWVGLLVVLNLLVVCLCWFEYL